jgi:hypothetical protein
VRQRHLQSSLAAEPLSADCGDEEWLEADALRAA